MLSGQQQLGRQHWCAELTTVLVFVVISAAHVRAAEIVLRPVADGTIVDGGVFGPLDGTPDAADWYFNESSYEGAITFVRSPKPGIEHRIVFEYNLSTVTFTPPISARLTFSLRGAPRFPAPTAAVFIYAYDADLLENQGDFDLSPKVLVSVHEIEPFQVETAFVVDVGDQLNDALGRGVSGIGFRFQVNPDTPDDSSQAFMDVSESDPDTKPKLIVSDELPGDIDGDRDIDLNDYLLFPFCMDGATTAVPLQCRIFDLDGDDDVDLLDFGIFTRLQAFYAGQ